MALAKWFKVDFHVHTPASKCFADKSISPENWLQAAKSSGMNGIVITDHNSIQYLEEINAIKDEYEEKNKFKVFYGIEVSVSSDYTHFIIIFNDKLSLDTIKDDVVAFLGIRRENWGDTTHNVSDVQLFDLYNNRKNDVFIIPAHFASNKGLGKSNVNAIKKYTKNIDFAAIEIRNDEDMREYNNKLRDGVIKECATITGSDNPQDRDEGKHCLEGIGKKFTWIKSATLDFEGLRQVFIDPDYRILDYAKLSTQTEDYSPNDVYKNYISGIELNGFKHVESMSIRFSPHFNCIVGGRGTGKSTFVESIRASLQGEKVFELKDLMKKTLNKDGRISTYYNFGSNNPYKINVTKLSSNKYEYSYENESGEIDEPPAFLADIYSQKEIYSLVEDDSDVSISEESPLIKIVDEKNPTVIYSLRDRLNKLILELLAEAQKITNYRSNYKELSVVRSEVRTYETKIKKYEEYNLSTRRLEYNDIKDKYEKGLKDIDKIIYLYSDFNRQISDIIDDIDYDEESEKSTQEVKFPDNYLTQSLKNLTINLEKELVEVSKIKTEYEVSHIASRLKKAEHEYKKIVEELKIEGSEDILEIEEKLNSLKIREVELYNYKEEELNSIGKIEKLVDEYVLTRQELAQTRKSIIEAIDNQSLKIEIEPMAHLNRLIRNIQVEFGKEDTYNQYFKKICEKIADDKDDFRNLKEYIIFILTSKDGNINQYLDEECNESRFIKLWKDKMKKGTLGSLLNILPEDMVKIKIIDKGIETDINEGSPGQKSAAVLAFLLSNGNNPLIIDQPEDDLDNSLIYNLIVTSIRKMKLNRQIIMVSHNPNIPVLGDAEGIIILDRNEVGKVSLLNNKKAGCIEEKVIRDGICEIMEGGEVAFKKREMKYMYDKI